MSERRDDDDPPRVNIGFALGQLAKALSGAGKRAAQRVEQWRQVIAGITDGSLSVGTRAPVAETPAWVTLDVVHGGFATGGFAASGTLQLHERTLLAALSLPLDPPASARVALNAHFAGEDGALALSALLADGCYRVRVPEEGALLVATWLALHGERERAVALLDVIAPFYDRLRFYPLPHDRPLQTALTAHVRTAGECVASLRAVRPSRALPAMREAIQVWTPLYDRAVALFLETVDGELPSWQRDAEGAPLRAENGQPMVVGGWPCQRYAPDWPVRVAALLDDYHDARADHSLCGKPERAKENFAQLRGYLERCAREPQALSGRDVGTIRKILASYVARHGAPGSERLQATRANQQRAAQRAPHHLLARLTARRLERHPPDEGVEDLAPVLAAIGADEVAGTEVAPGEALPAQVVTKAERCLEAPIETLAERGLLPSGEALARVLPAVSGQVVAAAITDPELRRLYAASYSAFRRRRSLLLLNLASQVGFRELPWIAAVQPWLQADAPQPGGARAMLVQVARLALDTFPHAIIPNKLVKELRALASAAGVPLVLTDELAADIFMGAFSQTFLRAGQQAARALRGSLYERYYALPYERVLQLDDLEPVRSGTPASPGFARICEQLADVRDRQGGRAVARNGAIIEQAQILTTHNLVALYELGLPAAELALPLARRCFEWICRRQQQLLHDWNARLRMLKNTAYAWRQMIFFLSWAGPAELDEFLRWSEQHFARQSTELRARFEPAMAGLRAVAHGGRFDADGFHAGSQGRRFLGWAVGSHWLMPEKPQRS